MQITLTPEQIAAVVQQALGGSGSPAQTVTAKEVTFTRDAQMRRIDDVMPPGTHGTVTCPVTGHVLSTPQAEANELIMGYAFRTQKQTGIGPNVIQQLGALAYLQGGLKTAGPTPSYWPFMVDEFFNRDQYNPVSKEEAAQTAKAWADEWDRLRQSQGTPATPAAPTDPIIGNDSGNAPA